MPGIQRISPSRQGSTQSTPSGGNILIQTKLDKRLPALVTVADGALALATPITETPAADSYVAVYVNGVRFEPGDGNKIGVQCYFSNDGGVTALLIKDISNLSYLYWNQSVTGFNLDTADRISLDYLVYS